MDTPKVVKIHDVHLNTDYSEWIYEVKERYRNTQIKAAVKVNAEQLMFNWALGRDLVKRKAEEKWGSGIVEQVSLDLQDAFPSAKGFSTTNLWNMKKWYLFYSEKLQQLVGETFDDIPLKQFVQYVEDGDRVLQQAVGEKDFPEIFAFVPWGHHIQIITKCQNVDEAIFYLKGTIREGWSRNALINCIKADYYHKKNATITTFDEYLPATQSKLAKEITKDTYDLGFISLPPEYGEKDLEDALEKNITQFLLELGTGFAFVGRQKEVIVAGKTRKIDMLFYHIKLKCYVVVELKVVPFEPEFVGKLNFYVNAVDELFKEPMDNPSIGLLICKEMNRTEVKWAFSRIETPMGVATYDNVRISEMREQLPTVKEIQMRMQQAENEYRLNKIMLEKQD